MFNHSAITNSSLLPTNQRHQFMQGRPSSGLVPLMNALEKIVKIKGAGMKPWKQARYIDHLLAEPVLVGGARRAARMSTKHWSDADILDFIEVKRPIEFQGLSMDEVIEYRRIVTEEGGFPPMAFLWSSNNSVTVDEEFWHRVRLPKNHPDYQTPKTQHARRVLQRVAECAYGDGTGEPGIINQHLLISTADGQDKGAFRSGDYVGSNRYQVKDETRTYLQRIQKIVRGKTNAFIVNPCGACVTSDTEIMTVLGPRPVAELMEGAFDALVNGKAVRASAFRTSGVVPIYEIVTAEGCRLKCSAEHRLFRYYRRGPDYVLSEEIPACRVAVGDRLEMGNHRRMEVCHEHPDFDVGWAVGHIKGNGGHNPGNSSGTYLRFWHGEEYDLELRADALVRSLGVSGSYSGGYHNRTNGTWTIRSEQLSRMVDQYLFPLTKDIRPALLHGSAPLVAGFLQGFFDSDGSPQGNTKKGRSVRLNQSNDAELLKVQQMLLRFGIMSKLVRRCAAGVRLMPDGRGGQKLYPHKEKWEIIIQMIILRNTLEKLDFHYLQRWRLLSASHLTCPERQIMRIFSLG